jgi:hypothetical protein
MPPYGSLSTTCRFSAWCSTTRPRPSRLGARLAPAHQCRPGVPQRLRRRSPDRFGEGETADAIDCAGGVCIAVSERHRGVLEANPRGRTQSPPGRLDGGSACGTRWGPESRLPQGRPRGVAQLIRGSGCCFGAGTWHGLGIAGGERAVLSGASQLDVYWLSAVARWMMTAGPSGSAVMPMLDAFIPEDALTASAEEALLGQLTDLLLLQEGADPANPAARSLAWVFLHRPETGVRCRRAC